MNIDNFVQSELKVVASENIDISHDLEQLQTKNISELLINEKEKTEKNNKEQEDNS